MKLQKANNEASAKWKEVKGRLERWYWRRVDTERSSLPEVFYTKVVLRHFPKFTGKHLCESLFS